MLNKLTEARNSVKGTCEYNKFNMPCYKKYDDDNKWKFIYCWGIPLTTGKIKTFKNNTYIITEHKSFWGNYLERYEVTDTVKKLLEI